MVDTTLSLDSLLGISVAKALCNTSYEKRKQAALEVEKRIRDANHETIRQTLLILRDYIESPTPNARKGGLIGLAAVALGLDNHNFLFHFAQPGAVALPGGRLARPHDFFSRMIAEHYPVADAKEDVDASAQQLGGLSAGGLSGDEKASSLSSAMTGRQEQRTRLLARDEVLDFSRTIQDYMALLIPPVLTVFEDEHPRVRYYACEALYNIVKVAKTNAFVFFNEIWDGCGRHIADMDKEVKSGAVYLDKVLKDILTETPVAKQWWHSNQMQHLLGSGPSDAGEMFLDTDDEAMALHPSAGAVVNLATFMPLLAQRILSKNPFLLSFLVGWVQLLQSIPDLDLYPHLPDFLPGLFGMLSETVKDIRVKADQCLRTFLDDLRSTQTPMKRQQVIYSTVKILAQITRSERMSLLSRTSALYWIQTYVDLTADNMMEAPDLVPLSSPEEVDSFELLPVFLSGVLCCLDSQDRELAKIAVETHSALLEIVDSSGYGRYFSRSLLRALIHVFQREMAAKRARRQSGPGGSAFQQQGSLPAEQLGGENASGASGANPPSDLKEEPTVDDDVVLKTASLQWLCMLLSNKPDQMLELSMDLFDPLFETLSHPDTEVVIAALQVLARIMTASREHLQLHAASTTGEGKIGGQGGGEASTAAEGATGGRQSERSSLSSTAAISSNLYTTTGRGPLSTALGTNAARVSAFDALLSGPQVGGVQEMLNPLNIDPDGPGVRLGVNQAASSSSLNLGMSNLGGYGGVARTSGPGGGASGLGTSSRDYIPGSGRAASSKPSKQHLRLFQLFPGVCRKLLDLFRVDPQMFDQRGRLVIRQLCDKLDCEPFYRTIAELVRQDSLLFLGQHNVVSRANNSWSYTSRVERDRHRQFLAQTVEIYNWILLTSRETHNFRGNLLRETPGESIDDRFLDVVLLELEAAEKVGGSVGGSARSRSPKKKDDSAYLSGNDAGTGVNATNKKDEPTGAGACGQNVKTTATSAGSKTSSSSVVGGAKNPSDVPASKNDDKLGKSGGTPKADTPGTAASEDAFTDRADLLNATPSLFLSLLIPWLCDPLSALALALWCEQYSLAHVLAQKIGALGKSDANFLNQLDQLVHLFESPVFLRARMRLLDPAGNAELLKTLAALCMILPQGSAFEMLQKRLALVSCSRGLLPAGGVGDARDLDDAAEAQGGEGQGGASSSAKNKNSRRVEMPMTQIRKIVRLCDAFFVGECG
ncbi:unnamed protein product [Amoebophrya sp. A25]|nr:unnamed protein product [Amoebophrya sp. A25]|eukprot:GSA25T00004441001.1